MIGLRSLFLCGAVLACAAGALGQAAAKGTSHRQILNVVLIELDASPDGTLPAPVVNDWAYWDSREARLLRRLDSDLGYRRAVARQASTDASLYSIKVVAKGLDDAAGLAPLIKELDAIGRLTQRPSMLVMCVRSQGAVLLGLADHNDVPPALAIAMFSQLRVRLPQCGLFGFAECGYIAPPTVLVARAAPAGGPEPLLGEAVESLLHSLAACETYVLLKSPVFGLAGANPAGVSLIQDRMEAVKLNPSQWNVNRLFTDLRTMPTDVQTKYIGMIQQYGADNPGWASHFNRRVENIMTWNGPGGWGRFYSSMMPKEISISGGIKAGVNIGPVGISAGRTVGIEFGGLGGQDHLLRATSNMYDLACRARLTRIDPSGILLQPKLEIVVEKNGLTSAIAAKAVAAVHGKATGEFTHEGKTYIAAKTPGTSNLFRVPAGAFRVAQRDATMRTDGHRGIDLTRYYDSSSGPTSSFGTGWSVLPFSLEISQPVKLGDGKHEAGSRVVLVDRQQGARLAYRLESQAASTQPSQDGSVAAYIKLSSALQPDLVMLADGGYRAVFAHGLIVAFDRNGQVQWVGREEGVRVEYVFEAERLKEIRGGPDVKIALSYNEKGQLVGAKAGERSVTYSLDEAGRLASVTGSEAGPCKFAYGPDGRLASLAGADAEPSASNTYDDTGRMLTHTTPRGKWRLAYDDNVGRAVMTDPQDRETTYYYDGFQRLVAYGDSKDKMTLLNYDVTGRILQVAKAELLNDPSGDERPRFKVADVVAPKPPAADEDRKE